MYFIESRTRSGLYSNASDVVCAGLRALAREELESARRFEEIAARLPQDSLTAEIEQDIERAIRSARAQEAQRSRK